MQVKQAYEIMRSRTGLYSANTSFAAVGHQFVQPVTISTSLCGPGQVWAQAERASAARLAEVVVLEKLEEL